MKSEGVTSYARDQMLKLVLLIFTVQIVADCIYSSTIEKSKPVSLFVRI